MIFSLIVECEDLESEQHFVEELRQIVLAMVKGEIDVQNAEVQGKHGPNVNLLSGVPEDEKKEEESVSPVVPINGGYDE